MTNEIIGSNISFMMEQFEKQIDRVVLERKSEIEARIAFKMEEIGKEAVQHIFSDKPITSHVKDTLE